MTVVTAETCDTLSYWDGYYAGADVPAAPSAFAHAVASRWRELHTVIDVGCGNGRDAALFLKEGRSVVGLDSCAEAIGLCRQRYAGFCTDPAPQARFLAGPADHPETWRELANAVPGPVLIYARFLFHAVPDLAELAILHATAELLRSNGGVLCAEFRTPRDAGIAKAMPPHYRRFVDPDAFCTRLEALGLSVAERVEGQGMAVWRDEDAYVARIAACP